MYIYFFKLSDEADKKSTEKITTPYMTKYERARVLGTRALQIGKNFCLLKITLSLLDYARN